MYPDQHPLPNIQDIFDSSVGNVFLSVVDQSKDYHQIDITKMTSAV